MPAAFRSPNLVLAKSYPLYDRLIGEPVAWPGLAWGLTRLKQLVSAFHTCTLAAPIITLSIRSAILSYMELYMYVRIVPAIGRGHGIVMGCTVPSAWACRKMILLDLNHTRNQIETSFKELHTYYIACERK